MKTKEYKILERKYNKVCRLLDEALGWADEVINGDWSEESPTMHEIRKEFEKLSS